MIRINQIKLPYQHSAEDLELHICKQLRIKSNQINSWHIIKKSIDARKKPYIYAIYTVDISALEEEKILGRCNSNQVSKSTVQQYKFQSTGDKSLKHRPIIVGSGPAGLFCAYMLAKHGYRPILLERGAQMEQRIKTVEHFWATGVLETETNVQFGEGGAGTFSDGKLNTMVKDKCGYQKEILEIFVKHGAPKEILYMNKPHIGTDVLVDVVINIRNAILEYGGDIRFQNKLTDLCIKDNKIHQITVDSQLTQTNYTMDTTILILAIGHSARDTFKMLHTKKIPLEAKSFAVGFRVEHPQTWIDENQYGVQEKHNFPPADYKVTTQLPNGRGVYSFCMCPGGYVVDASSEADSLAVNGMSYHKRDSGNANSAIIVTVPKEDFDGSDALAGLRFQRVLEKAAFKAGQGSIPVQRFEDFCKNIKTTSLGIVRPRIKGTYNLTNLRGILPKDIEDSIEAGMHVFDKKIKGFAHKDSLLSGIESRTSSPIRITRNDILQSAIEGLYPCGEGAGYAGGITSASMDGIKVAEIVAKTYKSFD